MSQQEKGMNLQEQLTKLSLLTEGKTMFHDFTIAEKSTWYCTIFKTKLGESRYTMLDEIKNVMKRALLLYDNNNDPVLLQHIKQAVIGITSLLKTYEGDDIFLNKVMELIKIINKDLDTMKQHNYDIYDNHSYTNYVNDIMINGKNNSTDSNSSNTNDSSSTPEIEEVYQWEQRD